MESELHKVSEGIVPELRDGLSAVFLPELHSREGGKVSTGESVLNALNEFLGALNAQGATIVQILDEKVSGFPVGNNGRGLIKSGVESVRIAIVDKRKPA